VPSESARLPIAKPALPPCLFVLHALSEACRSLTAQRIEQGFSEALAGVLIAVCGIIVLHAWLLAVMPEVLMVMEKGALTSVNS
jgi:hypothetical protein